MTEARANTRVQGMRNLRTALIAKVTHAQPHVTNKRRMLQEICRITLVLNQKR